MTKPMAPLDRGVRLVKHTGECDYAEDPAMAFRAHIVLSPPEFMAVAWACLHGGVEEVIVQAHDLAGIDDFIKRNELDTHPRYRRATITGPNLTIERHRGKPEVRSETTPP